MAGAEEGNAGNDKRRRKRKRKKTPDDPLQRRLEACRARANLIWAIAHPVRRRILRTLAESREVHTPTWLAGTLDIPTATAIYHVTILRKFDAIELAGEQMDAIEHLPLPTVEDEPPIDPPHGVDDEDTRGDKA